jgi:hypothetical protein
MGNLTEQIKESYTNLMALSAIYDDAPEGTHEEDKARAAVEAAQAAYDVLRAEQAAQKAAAEVAGYRVSLTDTAESITGGILAAGETAAWNSDQMRAVVVVAKQLAAEQQMELRAYGQNPQIRDDGRIAAAIAEIRAARNSKQANQAPTYPCAGAANGCVARVLTPLTFCARCQHDED